MTNNDLAQIDELIKKNLKGFTTKKDLEGVATKQDLKQFATKNDLSAMETRLEKRIKQETDEVIVQITKAIIPLEERVEKIEDRLGIITP